MCLCLALTARQLAETNSKYFSNRYSKQQKYIQYCNRLSKSSKDRGRHSAEYDGHDPHQGFYLHRYYCHRLRYMLVFVCTHHSSLVGGDNSLVLWFVLIFHCDSYFVYLQTVEWSRMNSMTCSIGSNVRSTK